MDSKETYRLFARFYDSYVHGFADDIPLYLDFCANAGSILEVGCGTGRVLKPVLEKGYAVTGIDISDEMLEIAENNLKTYLANGRLELLNHNLVNTPLPAEYQLVLVTFYTFNYLLKDSEQADFLKNVRASMKPGGMLLMDLFYPSVLSKPEKDDKWQAEKEYIVDGAKVVLRDKRRMVGSVEERLQIFSTGEAASEIKTLRRFVDKGEVYRLLCEAGFKVVRFTDGYSLSEFHPLGPFEKTGSSFVAAAQA